MKDRICITIDRELLETLDKAVISKKYANRSHAMEYLIKNHINH